MDGERDQQELIAFLARAGSYRPAVDRVEQITTHISHIFLAGAFAYKLKRAVRLPYLDFTTPALRRTACERELTLNRRSAPELYLRVAAVTRKAGGGFELDGPGSPADWLVVMRRFGKDCLLRDHAISPGLTPETLRTLGDEIARFHRAAAPIPGAGGAVAMGAIIAGNAESFGALARDIREPASVQRLQERSLQELAGLAGFLDGRRDAGKVRHCHGDLHLKNICLIDGKPVLFDCIEFSDRLSAIDVLYDLAFLLMDFIHLDLVADANAVFNRYLDLSGDDTGIPALPLFMSLRAAIRAHVTASGSTDASAATEARDYLVLALRLLDPAPARLLAIGGLSGTGKSTLARQLAPWLGRAPGARILRSDVIRKTLFGLPPESRLGPEGYTGSATRRVYRKMGETAEDLLRAGHSVIVDAVFARPDERAEMAAIAERTAVRFQGLWLGAPAPLLEQRIGQRRGDASDADITVLRQQLTFDPGPIDWTQIDVSGDPEAVARAAQDQIIAVGD